MIDAIALWHRRANPNPSYEAFQTQLGCFFEEVAEVLDETDVTDINHKLLLSNAADLMERISVLLKDHDMQLRLRSREDFLKEMCDVVVTCVGSCYAGDMAIVSAIEEVNRSNWSKFDENGEPLRDKRTGKILKGERYSKANLKGMA
jgi:predicted HAD superfamily Cof-like phosphohydrolase